MIRVEPLIDALQGLFDAGAAERLGWTLLHSLWQGAAVAALLSAALLALRRRPPRSRHAASLAALLLLAALPATTFFLLPATPPRAPFVAAAPVVPAPRPVPIPRNVAPDMPVPRQPAAVPLPPPPAAGLKERLALWLPALVAAWLVGVTLFSLWHLSGFLRVRRLRRRHTRPLDDAWQRRFTTLCRRMRVTRPVQLLESGLAEVPTVAGWLRPVILVPTSAVAGLPPHELEAILAHELAHVRRHDYLVCVFQAVVETLLFYHPAAWWISGRVRREREDCCDDDAAATVGGPVPYGRALAALDELRPGASAPHLALAASGSPLLRRVRRLFNPPPAPPTRAIRGLGSLAAAVLAATLAFLPAAVTRLGAQAQAPVDPTTGAAKPADAPAGNAADKAERFTLKGTVVDARTGKPIEKFRSVLAFVHDGPGPAPRATPWQGHRITHHQDGTFEIPLDNAWPGTRVRVDADGYLPAASDVIRKQAGAVTFDFRLEPSKGVSGVVVTPDNQPAAGAHVTLATITNSVMVYDGKFVFGGAGGALTAAVYTGADGAFTLPPEIDPGTIVATHPGGYAEVPAEEFRNGLKIRLRPWGAVKGKLDVPGVARDDLKVVASSSRPDDAPYVTHQQVVRPDADGAFRIEHFAPGRATVGIHAGTHNGTPVVGTFATVEVPAGDAAELTLGGRGRPLVGRVTTGDKPARSVDFSKVKLRLALEAPHIGFPGDDVMWQAYGAFLSGDRAKAYAREFTPAADGTFRLDNVPQGRYQLLGPVLIAGRVEVAPMPGGFSDDPQNLGDLPLTGDAPAKPAAANADPDNAAAPTTEFSADDIARIDAAIAAKVARRDTIKSELARLGLTLLPEHRTMVELKKDLAALEAEIEAALKDFRAKWVPADPAAGGLLAKRDEVKQALDLAMEKFGQQHPQVLALRRQLESAEARLRDHLPRAPAARRADDAGRAAEPEAAAASYYIGGRVPRPGVYQLQSRRVNLLQALVAAGFDPTKDLDHEVQLLRRKAGEDRESVTTLPVKDLLDHRERDVFLQADDVVLVKPPADKAGTAAPEKRTTALVVRDADNFFLDKAVASLAGVDPTFVKRAAWAADKASAYDVVIFDRIVPADLPAGGKYVFVGCCPPGVRLRPGGDGKAAFVRELGVSGWDRDHPILRGLDMGKVYVAEATKLAPGGGSEVLVSGNVDDAPLVVLHREAGSTYLVVAFDLLQSNWPLKVSFPVFMHQALAYLAADGR